MRHLLEHTRNAGPNADTVELHRSFGELDLDVQPAEGRVEGLVVPYNKPADIAELREDGPIRYREQFAPGSMERAQKAPNRVALQFTHSDRLDHQIGYGLQFRDSAEGCVGLFQLYRQDRERVVEMLQTSHRGLSLTFVSLRPFGGLERDGELVTRQVVAVRAVAAVNDPAYADAGVVAVRQQAELAELVAREAEQKREDMREFLQYLLDAGQPLSESQRAWARDHDVPLRFPEPQPAG
jgi:phage head maturation protease